MNIALDCIECGQCAKICEFLKETGMMPAQMAKQGVSVEQAYSCTLCGACEAVCPAGLSPKQLFAQKRLEAVSNAEIDIQEFRYLFPDRTNNVLNVYREYYNIDYCDLTAVNGPGTWFFPGCTLLTYSPGLTQEIYRRLRETGQCQGISTECCGKPLAQIGLKQRAEDTRQRLQDIVKQHRVERIITACPGCYYELEALLPAGGVTVQTVYEVLEFAPQPAAGQKTCTIHDACPDRFQLKFAAQVRQALTQCGYALKEMPHCQAQAVCCGSGGQISHFRPDLTEKLVDLRLTEAAESKADILVAYCLSCVLKFAGKAPAMPVTHALNILLALPPDFYEAKERARQMLTGSEGEKIWEKIMAEDSRKKET